MGTPINSISLLYHLLVHAVDWIIKAVKKINFSFRKAENTIEENLNRNILVDSFGL